MSIYITVGITHDDAALEQLERVAVTASRRAEIQAEALAEGCAEILLLSTCSRIELHAVLDLPGYDDAPSRRACWAVADRLVRLLTGDRPDPVGRATVAVDDDAVRHLFRVAAGLGSRIVGETEVQAQLRSTARSAAAREGEPHRLRRVVTAAIAAAREAAREQPTLLRRGLLAERAVARALEGHDPGEPVEVLVVGAGTMGRQVLAALPEGCRATLLSRSCSAKGVGPRIHPLEDLPAGLATADVVFVATSAGRRIMSAALVRDVLARRTARALTIVDLSLPRNVDPSVVAVPGVRLLDLDDLSDAGSAVIPDVWALETAAAATVAAAEGYCAEIRSRRAGPVITTLRDRLEEVCRTQLRRTTRGMDVPEESLERMATAVAAAVAHAPTVLARHAAAEDDEATLELLAAAFGLDDAGGVTHVA